MCCAVLSFAMPIMLYFQTAVHGSYITACMSTLSYADWDMPAVTATQTSFVVVLCLAACPRFNIRMLE